MVRPTSNPLSPEAQAILDRFTQATAGLRQVSLPPRRNAMATSERRETQQNTLSTRERSFRDAGALRLLTGPARRASSPDQVAAGALPLQIGLTPRRVVDRGDSLTRFRTRSSQVPPGNPAPRADRTTVRAGRVPGAEGRRHPGLQMDYVIQPGPGVHPLLRPSDPPVRGRNPALDTRGRVEAQTSGERTRDRALTSAERREFREIAERGRFHYQRAEELATEAMDTNLSRGERRARASQAIRHLQRGSSAFIQVERRLARSRISEEERRGFDSFLNRPAWRQITEWVGQAEQGLGTRR